MVTTFAAALPAMMFVAVLVLILLLDWRERRIANWLTLPATALALGVSAAQGAGAFGASLLGAACGFVFFYALCALGRALYGSSALGMGDVKLAMLLGAMLGIQQVLPALALGMLLAGLAAILLLARRRARHSVLPYGSFMAAAGILTLMWNYL